MTDIPWTTIEPLKVHPHQTYRLRFREWVVLTAADRVEEVVAEFGDEIFDVIESTLNRQVLKGEQIRGITRANLAALGRGFITQLNGKTIRRYAIQYFADSEVEAEVFAAGSDEGRWVRLVQYNEDASTPDVEGLSTAKINIGVLTYLVWHLAVVHFGPLFGGLISKAGEKAESSLPDSSQLAATG